MVAPLETAELLAFARIVEAKSLSRVASPDYLAARGTPRSRAELRRHRCLMGFARGELPMTRWPLVGGGQVPVEGVLFSTDIGLLTEAAVRGLGIALLPSSRAKPLLETRALQQVLSGIVGASIQLAVVYAEREFLPPQVRAFIDAVVAWTERGRSGVDDSETRSRARKGSPRRTRAR